MYQIARINCAYVYSKLVGGDGFEPSVYLTNFAEKAPAFRHGDESARQTWHFGKTLLQNDEVSGIIVASLDSPKESGCAGDEKETA